MASIKRPPSDPPGGRRRRPPTVINLEATEVTPPSSESPPAAEPPEPQQQAAETAGQSEPKPEDVPPEQAAFEPPPQPEPTAEVRPTEPPPQAEPAEPAAEAPMPPPASPSRTPIIAGLSGVGGGLVVVLLLWLFGAFSTGQPLSPAQQASSSDLSLRLAAIEQQLKELAARPAPANPRALNEIAERLAKLESAVNAPRMPATDPVLQNRIAAAEVAAKTTADNVAGLSRRIDTLETALRDTNSQLEKLAAASAELQARMRETGAGADRPSRLAAAAGALRGAVERGEPYAAELAVVKPLTTDAAAVAILEPFAASGLPNEAALGQELAAIIRPMLNTAAEAPRDGTFLEKLQANAEKLVRIRPIGEAHGDDRIAVLIRTEQRAREGNIAVALTELQKLPAEVRAQPALRAWTAKAEARSKAVEASRKLNADAVTALKATP